MAFDSSFTFATALDDESDYAVTVLTQPTTPNQTCMVTNGSGTLAGVNVTEVAVSCVINTYTVGGSVNGLAETTSVVLQNNGGDDLSVSADGSLTFNIALDDGSAYAVTVLTQPTGPNQTCTVTNGSGTLAGANVTDVAVSCVFDPPTAVLTKTANPEQVKQPGGPVSFRINIKNTSPPPSREITITGLSDDVHGDLNGQGDCSVPQIIAQDSSYSCTFTANVNGTEGYVETDVVTALGSDTFGNNVTADDDATVTVISAIPCGLPGFGMTDVLLRDTAAEWLLKCYYHNPGYPEPTASGTVFADVAQDDYNAGYIEQLFSEGITEGCDSGGSIYCPKSPVDKTQAPKLILRAEHGGSYVPPPAAAAPYADIPQAHPEADWIAQAKAEGITTGCGDGTSYCPGEVLTQEGFIKTLGGTF